LFPSTGPNQISFATDDAINLMKIALSEKPIIEDQLYEPSKTAAEGSPGRKPWVSVL
jgi:hypothetical protein